MKQFEWAKLLKIKFIPLSEWKYNISEDKPQLSISDVERAYVGDKKSKEYISLIDNLKLIIKQKQQ